MSDDYKNVLRVLIEYEIIEQPCGYFFKDSVLDEAFDILVDEENGNYCDQHCGNEIEDCMKCWCEFARLVKENEERRSSK